MLLPRPILHFYMMCSRVSKNMKKNPQKTIITSASTNLLKHWSWSLKPNLVLEYWPWDGGTSSLYWCRMLPSAVWQQVFEIKLDHRLGGTCRLTQQLKGIDVDPITQTSPSSKPNDDTECLKAANYTRLWQREFVRTKPRGNKRCSVWEPEDILLRDAHYLSLK